MNLAGRTLAGRYQVVREIGEGGMGVVFEAIQLGLGRRVAIKLVSPEVRHNPDALTRFRREAEAAAALGHPNIVQVTDFVDTGDGQPFIVMEMVDGESLRTIVAREGRLEPTRVCFIASQILSALSAAHRAGIVHRDIKPGNVVITTTAAIRDFVKLVDFGIAKLQRPGAVPSAVNTVVGTPSYMAPEQAAGTDVDARADVYGVAATMLNALTAHPPPHPPIPPIAHVAPWVPPALATVLDRALAMNPLARHASADAMLEALAPFLREGGIDPASLAGGHVATRSVPPARISGPPPTPSGAPATPYASTHPAPYAPHAFAAPHVSAPPPRTPYGPNTGVPPTMPSNMPPVAAASSSSSRSGSAGWIVAVILGLVLLLVLLGGGGLAAYFYMNQDAGETKATTTATATATATATSTATIAATGTATGTAAGTSAKTASTSVKPVPTTSKDAGAAIDASAPAADAGGGGNPIASKRTYRMGWFRPSDNYDLLWVNKKLSTPAFGNCLDRSFFDPVEDRQGLWTIGYDPNGEVFEVFYAPTYKKGGGTNAQLRDCAKAAWIGAKLGPGRHPGSGNLQITIDVKSE